MLSRLILNRRKGEKVLINSSDGDITITVVDGKGPVRLAFEGPHHIPINREEIAKKKGINTQ